MVSAQEPVERNKSSLLQAVVWLWTRQSLTDKLCTMREDRSRAHVLRALTGKIKSPSVWWFLCLFYLFMREIIKKTTDILTKKGKFGVFSNGWPIKISEEGYQNTSEGDETESLVWGVWGEGPQQPFEHHQESWMVLCGGSGSFAEDKLSESEILGDDVRGPRLWKGFVFYHENEKKRKTKQNQT